MNDELARIWKEVFLFFQRPHVAFLPFGAARPNRDLHAASIQSARHFSSCGPAVLDTVLAVQLFQAGGTTSRRPTSPPDLERSGLDLI
jgi:hypothetical protein